MHGASVYHHVNQDCSGRWVITQTANIVRAIPLTITETTNISVLSNVSVNIPKSLLEGKVSQPDAFAELNPESSLDPATQVCSLMNLGGDRARDSGEVFARPSQAAGVSRYLPSGFVRQRCSGRGFNLEPNKAQESNPAVRLPITYDERAGVWLCTDFAGCGCWPGLVADCCWAGFDGTLIGCCCGFGTDIECSSMKNVCVIETIRTAVRDSPTRMVHRVGGIAFTFSSY
jgi:hypothetical protein